MPTRTRIRPAKPADSLAVAKLCLAAALGKKAEEPLLLDVAQASGYADYFLLLSGRSTRQATAIAEAVQGALKKAGVKPLGADGVKDGRWAVLDFGDVVVHVFHHPVREFYDLESLWSDAPQVAVDPAELEGLIPAPEPIRRPAWEV
ncbi:MAG: ribosome silencing factor [Desulfarculus sp.]|nr:ribosome silencing factor [Desulfarculus sp.]